MNDSHLRTTITPTLTFKAKFVKGFSDFESALNEPMIMKINIAQKVNRNIQHNKNEREFAHLNNCDDINTNSKANFDYWPIPDTMTVTIEQEEFIPRDCIQTICIKTKPLEYLNEEYLKSIKDKIISPLIDSIERYFNLNSLQKIFETYQITDHNFVKHLSTLNLWPDQWILNPNFKDCKPLYFECCLQGDTNCKPFALMKITRRQAKSMLDTASQADSRKSNELLKIPYRADLIILPLNFVQFISLLRIREKIEIQSNKETYLNSWKVLLDNYLQEIPNYYKFYLQAALYSMKYNEVYLLKKSKGEKALSSKLHDIVKKFKEEQSNLCIDREKVYLINLKSHRHIVFGGFPDCCRNLRCFLPKTSLKLQAKLQQVRNKSNLSLLDPFSFDRKNIILTVGSMAKDFNCKLSLEPKPDANSLDINQELLDQEKDLKKKLIAEDDHEKPIFCMGNVQAFRNYPVLKSINLTDKEFKIYTDISFGNLFTTAIKSKYHTAQAHTLISDLVDDSEMQEVESVFIFEELEKPSSQLNTNKEKLAQEINSAKSKEEKADSFKTMNSDLTSFKSIEDKRTASKQEFKEIFKKEPINQAVKVKNSDKVALLRTRKIVDLNTLIERFYKDNSELVRRIQIEVLNIAGSYPLQLKLADCGLKQNTLQIETNESERNVCRNWPIFREIKPKIIRKYIINRSLKRLLSFNINS